VNSLEGWFPMGHLGQTLAEKRRLAAGKPIFDLPIHQDGKSFHILGTFLPLRSWGRPAQTAGPTYSHRFSL
jgi:hypothetical protein